MANASTTKILTCILALEEGDPGGRVVFSGKAASQPKVHLGAAEGRSFFLRDLLYSLMLESHNDTAVAVAEYLAGSTERFAERMNRKAESLGCTGSHFVSPNGLDWEDEGGPHASTAADLARILRYCIGESPQREEFLAITRTAEYRFADAEGRGSFSCVNHNAFLGMMEGALTGKTGFTGKAGYCYVGALRDGERTFVLALLASGWPDNRTYKWKDARALFTYGLEHFRYERLIRLPESWQVPAENGVRDGREAAWVHLAAEGRLPEKMLLSAEDALCARLYLPRRLTAPAAAGTRAGALELLLNGERLLILPLRTEETLEEKNYRWCLRKTVRIWLGRENVYMKN